MSLLSSLNPILRHYLAASLVCLVLDAAIFEFLVSGAGWQVLLARLAALCLATGLFHAACRKLVFHEGRPPVTKKGQPLPFGVLAIASAVLSLTVFTQLLPLVPDGLAGRLIALALGNLAALGCNFFLLHSLLPGRGDAAKISLRPRTLWTLIVWGLLLLVAFTSASVMEHLRAVLSFPDLKLPLGPYGPDSWLRLTQVRQWLTGTDFFSHAVAGTNAPDGGIETPWTRPMDSLVSLFYFLTPDKYGINVRLLLAATWLPLFLGIGAVWLTSKAARLHFNSTHALACALMVFLISPYTLLDAGNADHHILLTLLWSAAIWLLLSEDASWRRGMSLGAVAGMMLWESPETLFFNGMVFALMGIESVLFPHKTKKLLAAAFGSTVVVGIGLFVEMPPDIALSKEAYDTLSVVHATLMALTLCGAAVMTLAFKKDLSLNARWVVGIASGAFVFLAQYILYPKFYFGPLTDVDPSILPDLLARVQEAQSLAAGKTELSMRILMAPALAAFLLGACLGQKHLRLAKKRYLLMSCVLLAGTFLMTFFQIRWGYYLQPVSAFIIAGLLPGYAGAIGRRQNSKSLSRKWRPYVVIWGVYLVFVLLGKSLAGRVPEPELCQTQLNYALQTGQVVKLLGDEELTLYTTSDTGGAVLFFTPYRIIASNYHREFAGLHDLLLIEKAPTASDARPMLEKRGVDALVFCPGAYKKESWLNKAKTSLPDWLEPVEGLDFIKDDGEKPFLLRVGK